MNDMPSNLFPRGLAEGAAFCDRGPERKDLKQRVGTLNHTWIAAPRRYGKTSLLTQTLAELERLRAARTRGLVADLLPYANASDLVAHLLRTVGRLAVRLQPRRQLLLELAGRYLGNLTPRLVISAGGPVLELSSSRDGQVEGLSEALVGLDRMALAADRRAVLMFDEFQQIGTLPESESLEAAIRHAVERSKSVAYLFSGSHRRLLAQIFTAKSRPLFRLCERFDLERISAPDYADYLNNCAKATWSKPLSEESLRRILALSERHPYYVNQLCRHLWRSPKPPVPQQVDQAWGSVVADLSNWIAGVYTALSRNQQQMLLTLATEPTDAPGSKAFLERARLSKSSAAQSLDVLLSEDLVEKDERGRFRLIDPAMAHYLSGN